MLSSVNGEPAWEAPWVTSLLRDVLLEEAFIPVWRYATEYQPCEESAKEAISELPIQEQRVLYSLYRDEKPLEVVYAELSMGAAMVGNVLGHAIAHLRRPCLLRIILKGRGACERESTSLQTLPVEDVMILGVEALSIPVDCYDVYVSAGVQTIEHLMCLLIYRDEECMGVPVSMLAATQRRMEELHLWAPLSSYFHSEENRWWLRLCGSAAALYRRCPCSVDARVGKDKVLSVLDQLPTEYGEVLSSIYGHGASERMFACRRQVAEEAVMELHHQALMEFARMIAPQHK